MNDQEQSEHAAAYGEVCRRLTGVATDFARGVASVLSPLDVAEAYAVAAASLVTTVHDHATAAALLRRVADALERIEAGEPTRN